MQQYLPAGNARLEALFKQFSTAPQEAWDRVPPGFPPKTCSRCLAGTLGSAGPQEYSAFITRVLQNQHTNHAQVPTAGGETMKMLPRPKSK